MQDDEFTGDMTALLRPTEKYEPAIAYEMVRTELLERIEASTSKKISLRCLAEQRSGWDSWSPLK